MDPSFTDAERGAIEAARADWNRELGREAIGTLTTGTGETCTVRRVTEASTFEELDGDYAWNGHHVAESGNVYLSPYRLTSNGELDSRFETIAMHEFGHGLGLDHVPEGVMKSPTDVLWTELSLDDRAECTRVGVCP